MEGLRQGDGGDGITLFQRISRTSASSSWPIKVTTPRHEARPPRAIAWNRQSGLPEVVIVKRCAVQKMLRQRIAHEGTHCCLLRRGTPHD